MFTKEPLVMGRPSHNCRAQWTAFVDSEPVNMALRLPYESVMKCGVGRPLVYGGPLNDKPWW